MSIRVVLWPEGPFSSLHRPTFGILNRSFRLFFSVNDLATWFIIDSVRLFAEKTGHASHKASSTFARKDRI